MAIMNQRRETKKRPASLLPGDRTTQPPSMQSIMQPSMQPNQPLGDQAPTTRGSVQTGPAPTIRGFVPGDPEPVSSSVAEAPAPGQAPTTTTSERTHAIIGKDSPLMRQAATRGRQYAHQRGLLNSSLAAGAAQGAVLDRGIELGKADVEDELRTFYAGLDKSKFESDANYRNRALDQEKQLQERKIEIDERVADSSINIAEDRLSFDRDRFSGDSAYRDRVLAQEREFQTERLSFDRDRFSSDSAYRDRVLAQEASLAKGRLDFDAERFRSDENYRRDVLAQEKEFQTERLTFDRERFASEVGYRDRVLEQEKELTESRLDFDVARFRSDDKYRTNVLAQEKDLETRRLGLVEEENDFRRKFDRQRFESDSKYRGEVLAQEKVLADKRVKIDLDQLGIQRDEISQNAYQGLRNTMSQLYANYQATVASIMSVVGMTAANRQSALDKARKDYDAARRDAGALSGPSAPIVWGEGDHVPVGPGGEGGYGDGGGSGGSGDDDDDDDDRPQWKKDRDACVARGGRWNHTGRFCEEADNPTPTLPNPKPGPKPTGKSSAQRRCERDGGVWNSRTNQCRMPTDQATPGPGPGADDTRRPWQIARDNCVAGGGKWDHKNRVCKR